MNKHLWSGLLLASNIAGSYAPVRETHAERYTCKRISALSGMAIAIMAFPFPLRQYGVSIGNSSANTLLRSAVPTGKTYILNNQVFSEQGIVRDTERGTFQLPGHEAFYDISNQPDPKTKWWDIFTQIEKIRCVWPGSSYYLCKPEIQNVLESLNKLNVAQLEFGTQPEECKPRGSKITNINTLQCIISRIENMLQDDYRAAIQDTKAKLSDTCYTFCINNDCKRPIAMILSTESPTSEVFDIILILSCRIIDNTGLILHERPMKEILTLIPHSPNVYNAKNSDTLLQRYYSENTALYAGPVQTWSDVIKIAASSPTRLIELGLSRTFDKSSHEDLSLDQQMYYDDGVPVLYYQPNTAMLEHDVDRLRSSEERLQIVNDPHVNFSIDYCGDEYSKALLATGAQGPMFDKSNIFEYPTPEKPQFTLSYQVHGGNNKCDLDPRADLEWILGKIDSSVSLHTSIQMLIKRLHHNESSAVLFEHTKNATEPGAAFDGMPAGPFIRRLLRTAIPNVTDESQLKEIGIAEIIERLLNALTQINQIESELKKRTWSSSCPIAITKIEQVTENCTTVTFKQAVYDYPKTYNEYFSRQINIAKHNTIQTVFFLIIADAMVKVSPGIREINRNALLPSSVTCKSLRKYTDNLFNCTQEELSQIMSPLLAHVNAFNDPDQGMCLSKKIVNKTSAVQEVAS